MRRAGFTLIELLIVIAIIAVLIALMVPAIQQARESASRLQCLNHMKQIGIALHNYHDEHHKLPPAGTDNPAINPKNGLPYAQARYPLEYSWAYWLLPYIEQQELFRVLSNGTPGAAMAVVSTYLCPTRRPGRLYHGVPVCDYAGNICTFDDGFFRRTETDATAADPVPTTILSRLTFNSMTDGLSTTLAVGERRLNLAMINDDPAFDLADNESYFNPGFDGDILRLGLYPPAADLNDGSIPPNGASPLWPKWQFGGSHHGGMNALLGDGSVRVIRFDIAPAVFRNLCQRDDGNPVDLGP
jgi:prepilin-type N-terminal cleavage/methylation domain-containing protein